MPNSLGVLDAASSTADKLCVLVLALLVQYKFYPLVLLLLWLWICGVKARWRAQGVNAAGRQTAHGFHARHGRVEMGSCSGLATSSPATPSPERSLLRTSARGRKIAAPLRFWLVGDACDFDSIVVLLTTDFGPNVLRASKKKDRCGKPSPHTRRVLQALAQRAGDYAMVTTGHPRVQK